MDSRHLGVLLQNGVRGARGKVTACNYLLKNVPVVAFGKKYNHFSISSIFAITLVESV